MAEQSDRSEERIPFLNKADANGQSAVVVAVSAPDKVPRKSSLVLGNSRSRFQVAKVDFANIPEAGDDGGEVENKPSGNSNAGGGGVGGGGGGGTQSPTYNSIDYSTYDTRYMRSLRHYTREPLPRASHYRDVRSIHRHLDRPTLDDLLNNTYDSERYKVSGIKTNANFRSAMSNSNRKRVFTSFHI
ncbi:hypothetical protein B4U79_12041 [Dinothrombium tinctorium]|uniref:Uncharacterized protein n=1 Tax=Dinothrombium tinctorium TaxID=1965070 RepID=A0A3S3PSN3_9ACAR|nr:hypothetical protein B4U79_12041 [Dinothrombium tinctorium]